MDETVTLIIPSAPEYVGVARLTLLGVASRLGFSYDAVEDIRLAVAEACTSSIARVRSMPTPPETPRITLRARGDERKLTVEVEDNSREARPAADGNTNGVEQSQDEEPELGALLMELFMDEVQVEPSPDGTVVRLVKYNTDMRH